MDIAARDFSRGFLPVEDPVVRLSAPFSAWEDVAQDLSKLALSHYLRQVIHDLPPFPVAKLATIRDYERAMTMLSYMANLYIFAPDHQAVTHIPKNLAVAWYDVASHLGRPPVLTYASQTLYNWRRIDPQGPIALGNLTLIQNFLGGMDEEWFVTVHVNIEASAAPALAAIAPAQTAAASKDSSTLEKYLGDIAETLRTMHTILSQMPKRCDPNIYYHRMRPYMFGWKDNPDLPNGMIYDGVKAYQGQPQQFRGETGAQSSIIAALDAALGIEHQYDTMRAYLMEMLDYMPAQDRAFIKTVEQGPSIRAYVLQQKRSAPRLAELYNRCIQALHKFRQLHIEYAALYILKPATGANKAAVGTGGTPFTVYLKKHIEETSAHLI